MKQSVLFFECEGVLYKVNQKGLIARATEDFNEQWKFIGVCTKKKFERPNIWLRHIFEKPKLMLNGVVWDTVNGNARAWSSNTLRSLPRVSRAYIKEVGI